MRAKKIVAFSLMVGFLLGFALLEFGAGEAETAKRSIFVIARSTDAKTLDAGYGSASNGIFLR